MDKKQVPLQLASCFALIIIDWLIYAATMLSLAKGLLGATILGALAIMVTVARVESDAGVARRLAIMRGVICGVIVAVPLPLAGTVVGLTFGGWALLARRERHGA